MFLTFSSTAVPFTTFEPINFSLHEVLNKSISLAQRNKMNPTFNEIPVVTFTTLTHGLDLYIPIGAILVDSNNRISVFAIEVLTSSEGKENEPKIVGSKSI